jgi:hypothetical protein
MHLRSMAPNLAQSSLEFSFDMIRSGELIVSQIAHAAGCSSVQSLIFAPMCACLVVLRHHQIKVDG